MLKTLGLLALLCSCNMFKSHPKKANDPTVPLEKLKEKLALYEANIEEATTGFQGWHDGSCDALLFTALTAAVSLEVDNLVDIEEAYDGTVWHRRPNFLPECYPDFSKSAISQDMILGVMYWAHKKGRVDVAEALLNYGEANDWVYGAGDTGRTAMVLPMRWTLKALVAKLQGKELPAMIALSEGTSIDDWFSTYNGGYRAHLAVVHGLLYGDIYGKLPGFYVEYFQSHAEKSPRNGLFSYAYHRYLDGKFDLSIASANDLFPDDGVVTSENHCTHWLWQRDDGEDWEPCPEGKRHSGFDFIFLARLILEG